MTGWQDAEACLTLLSRETGECKLRVVRGVAALVTGRLVAERW